MCTLSEPCSKTFERQIFREDTKNDKLALINSLFHSMENQYFIFSLNCVVLIQLWFNYPNISDLNIININYQLYLIIYSDFLKIP